jgi:GDP-4-dehydro-6-deoxy-D-mannose reductase
MRILITGITGFAGSHLAEYALRQGAEVWGTVRATSASYRIAHLGERVHLVECDLMEREAVERAVAEVMPEWVFHLAAQTFVPASLEDPLGTFATNVFSQVHLLEAVRRWCPGARVHIAGSSEEYGQVLPEELPVRETNPLRPLSPYAVSKVAQDLLGYQYHKTHGLNVVRTRAFNHEGPRHAATFALSNFALQIAEIEAGLREPTLRVGNLEAHRDYLDVRDVVRAYWLALDRGEPGEVYNVASGRAWRIGDQQAPRPDGVEAGDRLRGDAAGPAGVLAGAGPAAAVRGSAGSRAERAL